MKKKQQTKKKQDERRMKVVSDYLEKVLKYGRDKGGESPSPLFVDGVNIDTLKPVVWIYKNNQYIISNFASQQNLMRTFVAFSNLTGNKKYKEVVQETTEHMFNYHSDQSGLLYWGGHQFVDQATGKNVGEFDADCHEFKVNFPYYESMWKVNSEATTKFIRAFWNGHILDWERLDMNRHSPYDREIGKLWDHNFGNPEPFFPGDGLTFINCGSDLIYAAGLLYSLNNEEEAWEWGERMAAQYVKARHPVTGLGVYQYSKPGRRKSLPENEPLPTNSSYGDRVENQFGPEFGEIAREGWVLWGGRTRIIYVSNALMQLELAERLGEKGNRLLNWTVNGLKAYANHSYMPEKNQFKPMWADGTDMNDYELPRSGYYGKKGTIIKPVNAGSAFLFSYARAYRLSGEQELWEIVRSIAKGLNLGDFGSAPGVEVDLNLDTDSANTDSLFALIEISQIEKSKTYLELARVIGDNIIEKKYHKGFFLPDKNHINANFNRIEPLALLSLEAALNGALKEVPVYSSGSGYIHGRFGDMGRTRDSKAIWSQIY